MKSKRWTALTQAIRRALDKLLSVLAEYPNRSDVRNPYKSEELLANVEHYFRQLLSFPYSGDLIVGEAPGYAGCALTGIPFTSQKVIKTCSHPFIESIRSNIHCPGIQTEPTATIVWNYLSTRKRFPAMWNVFPFHPHPKGNRQKNRAPKADETKMGSGILKLVIGVLDPNRVIAVGRRAHRRLAKEMPHLNAKYIRHPSFRGKEEFIAGMNSHGVG